MESRCLSRIADHNLLFGLPALQYRLIDQAQLLELGSPNEGQDKTAGPVPSRTGKIDPDERYAVKSLVALHLKEPGHDVEQSLALGPAGHPTPRGFA